MWRREEGIERGKKEVARPAVCVQEERGTTQEAVEANRRRATTC